MNTCWSIVPPKTSLWTVSLTLIRLECGSVQMNPASTNFTSFNPFNFFKHNANNSLDSNEHWTHSDGGWRYRSQLRQKCNVDCLGISNQAKRNWLGQIFSSNETKRLPSVMSTWFRRHATHIFAGFGSIKVPHSQQRLNNTKQIIFFLLWNRKWIKTYIFGPFSVTSCLIGCWTFIYSIALDSSSLFPFESSVQLIPLRATKRTFFWKKNEMSSNTITNGRSGLFRLTIELQENTWHHLNFNSIKHMISSYIYLYFGWYSLYLHRPIELKREEEEEA